MSVDPHLSWGATLGTQWLDWELSLMVWVSYEMKQFEGELWFFWISKTAVSYWGSPLLPAARFGASQASEWKMIPSLSLGVPLGMWSLLPCRWRWWLRQVNAVAVPGVDGRWQEELLKGEWCPEPAPPWVTGIITQQISALPLTGEQLRCCYQFPG